MRDDQFFKDTPRKTLDMAGESIEFPILYYDFRMISATFTVKTNKLKKLLPHPNFKPIEILPGTGMIIIVAFEYRDTSIGPYNEIALSVPVNFPPKFVFPGLSAISMILKNRFSVYIHHLPVTTEIARKGGIHFYNYPNETPILDCTPIAFDGVWQAGVFESGLNHVKFKGLTIRNVWSAEQII